MKNIAGGKDQETAGDRDVCPELMCRERRERRVKMFGEQRMPMAGRRRKETMFLR